MSQVRRFSSLVASSKLTFKDNPGVQYMCQVDVYVPPHSQGRAAVATSGERYRSCEYGLFEKVINY